MQKTRLGGGQQHNFGELIPNLTRIALENVNFAHSADLGDSSNLRESATQRRDSRESKNSHDSRESKDSIGGITQLLGTGATIQATVAYMCAIPLILPFDYNGFTHDEFLDSARCVSDILADLGYKQEILAGTDFSFAGKRNFFNTHKIEVRDLVYFQNQNILPNPLPKELQGIWDLKDSKMFELAKNHLNSLDSSQPFALYLLSVDTHLESDFIDSEICADLARNYGNTFACSDRIIGDFIDFVRKSKWRENTTIIVLGDHLSMQKNFFPQDAKRFVYNAFINPRFTQKPTLERTKNRALSHFDIAPLILDSIGIKTESFGLGRNPLYGATLLESTFNENEFNALLARRNDMYDNFWRVR